MAILKFLTSILLLSSSALAAPASVLPRTLLKPSQDPWYQAPAGFESAKPGTVLKTRPAPNKISLLGALPEAIAAAYQILYRSTDSHGNAQPGVTTLLVPHNANFKTLVSYQTAEDSACVDCAPSYALQKDSSLATISTQAELILMVTALQHGYPVVTPDYLGPNSAFTAGIQSGHMTLDSIRAVLACGSITGMKADAKVVMWGYSGGALASGWAAQLQPTYAPELKIAGAALGGTTPNILNVLNRINKGPFAGLAPAGIMGLAAEYPELMPVIDDNLYPEKAQEFKNTVNYCEAEDAAKFAGKDIFSYFKNPAALQGPIPTKVINENNMGGLNPKIPLYVYKSIPDEVSPVADSDKLVNGWCANGVQVEYVKDLASEHVSLAITGAPSAFMWVQDRFNNKAPKSGCSTKTSLSTLLDPGAIRVLGTTICSALLGLLGKPIGPSALAEYASQSAAAAAA